MLTPCRGCGAEESRCREVLSREGAAIYAEAVDTWPRPNLDIGTLIPRPKDTSR